MASGVLPPPLDQAALEKLLTQPILTWFPENRGAENFETYVAWARSQGYPINGLEDLKKRQTLHRQLQITMHQKGKTATTRTTGIR